MNKINTDSIPTDFSTKRSKAMEWWSTLSPSRKSELSDNPKLNRGYFIRPYETLTGREIELLYDEQNPENG